MRVEMPVKICALISLATLGAGLPARAQYVGYLSVDQVGQQVTRQATDTVGQRGLALAAPGVDGPSLWFSTAYDYLSVRSPAAFGGAGQPSLHTDLSQTLFGAELRRGRLLVGLAGSVAVSRGRQAGYSGEYSFASPGGLYSSVYISRFDIGPLRIETEAYSIAPYVAFAPTKHVILTGTIGYTQRDYRLRPGGDTFTDTQELGPGWQALGLPAKQTTISRFPGYNISGTDGTVFTDVAANLVAPVRETGVTVAGRLGYRYTSSWSAPFNGPGWGGADRLSRRPGLLPAWTVHALRPGPVGVQQPDHGNRALLRRQISARRALPLGRGRIPGD
jgi:hypothetical protein